jgi:hypothetical protein
MSALGVEAQPRRYTSPRSHRGNSLLESPANFHRRAQERSSFGKGAADAVNSHAGLKTLHPFCQTTDYARVDRK